MSAVTGTVTARTMRATASIISRDGRKAFGLEHARAGGVPGVGEDENRRRLVEGAQPLSWVRHGAKYNGTRINSDRGTAKAVPHVRSVGGRRRPLQRCRRDRFRRA